MSSWALASLVLLWQLGWGEVCLVEVWRVRVGRGLASWVLFWQLRCVALWLSEVSRGMSRLGKAVEVW